VETEGFSATSYFFLYCYLQYAKYFTIVSNLIFLASASCLRFHKTKSLENFFKRGFLISAEKSIRFVAITITYIICGNGNQNHVE